MTVDIPSITASARDKFQGMWSSIRDAVSNPDEENSNSMNPSKSLSKLTDAAPATIDKVLTTMFGSCTTLIPEDDDFDEKQPSLKTSSTQSDSPEKPNARKNFKVDTVRNRAVQVVNSLRGGHATNEQQQQSQAKGHQDDLGPFKVTTPTRGGVPSPPPPPLGRTKASPEQSIPEIEHGEHSFDDGISAISAYTLEEMAKQDEVRKSTLVVRNRSGESFERIMEGNMSTESSLMTGLKMISEDDGADRLGAAPSPFMRARSAATKSTKSSHEFENAWKRDEEQFWNDEAGRPSSRHSPGWRRDMRNKSQSRGSELDRNRTVSTANSSQIDGEELFPSEEMLHANRLVQDNIISATGHDPDRIVTDDNLLIHQDAEIGEI
uniref:Uncharacterized protein n=1 Tax=Asterionellopsis glacialis TaxID=33640 RepID=A0A7S0KX28_9STRA|mmetsp:Transcript_1263/g.1758  ORF Transcript_1263/g.1758 Transcript_1263/m.1758 type:complete len:379 (+) Transcript_1263:98-1234(+)